MIYSIQVALNTGASMLQELDKAFLIIDALISLYLNVAAQVCV